MPRSENELREQIAEAEFDYQSEKRHRPFASAFPQVGVDDEDYEHISQQAERRIELEELRNENTTDRNGTP